MRNFYELGNNDDSLIQIDKNYEYNANHASTILLNLEKNNFFSSILHNALFVNINKNCSIAYSLLKINTRVSHCGMAQDVMII